MKNNDKFKCKLSTRNGTDFEEGDKERGQGVRKKGQGGPDENAYMRREKGGGGNK